MRGSIHSTGQLVAAQCSVLHIPRLLCQIACIAHKSAFDLQEHMVTNSDVLPRQGFTQMARNMRCQLYFPHPTEQVVLLRTGVLVHINAYMQTLGLSPEATSPEQEGPQSLHSNAQPDGKLAGQASPKACPPCDASVDQMDVDPLQGKGAAGMQGNMDGTQDLDNDQASGAADVGDGQQESAAVESPPAVAAAVLDWHGPIKPGKREELLRIWQHLKETVEALPHVGCYTVASIAYRR